VLAPLKFQFITKTKVPVFWWAPWGKPSFGMNGPRLSFEVEPRTRFPRTVAPLPGCFLRKPGKTVTMERAALVHLSAGSSNQRQRPGDNRVRYDYFAVSCPIEKAGWAMPPQRVGRVPGPPELSGGFLSTFLRHRRPKSPIKTRFSHSLMANPQFCHPRPLAFFLCLNQTKKVKNLSISDGNFSLGVSRGALQSPPLFAQKIACWSRLQPGFLALRGPPSAPAKAPQGSNFPLLLLHFFCENGFGLFRVLFSASDGNFSSRNRWPRQPQASTIIGPGRGPL